MTRACNRLLGRVCGVWCVFVLHCVRASKRAPNQMGSCGSTVSYYSGLTNCSPQKTLTENYKPNKQQRKARLSGIIKGFIWEI